MRVSSWHWNKKDYLAFCNCKGSLFLSNITCVLLFIFFRRLSCDRHRLSYGFRPSCDCLSLSCGCRRCSCYPSCGLSSTSCCLCCSCWMSCLCCSCRSRSCFCCRSHWSCCFCCSYRCSTSCFCSFLKWRDATSFAGAHIQSWSVRVGCCWARCRSDVRRSGCPCGHCWHLKDGWLRRCPCDHWCLRKDGCS